MIGIHIAKNSKIKDSKYKNMETAIMTETRLLGLNACQIYTHGPRNYKKNSMNYGKIRKYCMENNIRLSIHGSYVSIGIWKVNGFAEDDAADSAVAHIIDMLKSAKQLNAEGVVIHLPNGPVRTIVETMEYLEKYDEIHTIQNDGPYIILEMPASKPSRTTYETADKLNALTAALRNISLKWCLCIDTSHQYSCGVNFGDINVWEKWYADISDYTKSKITMLHLNGNSKKNFNRGKDIHEIIMSPSDGIWPDDTRSLDAIMARAKSNNWTVILEINRGEYKYTKKSIRYIQSRVV